eukprot:GHRR01025743.1.p1 GENE.GHRR01025743.1~~GHRR01025743.1.p1  ORF type:complete len:155 (+),score=40.77 GHRR01025743.1:617-1081(+)
MCLPVCANCCLEAFDNTCLKLKHWIAFYVCRHPDNKPIMRKLAPEITAEALEGDPIATAAVDMFLSIIGAEAGAMALRCLARGGVFIAGGIVPRMMQRVKQGVLLEAFVNRTARERFQYLLETMPLYVVTNTKAGIIGSREYALRLVNNQILST